MARSGFIAEASAVSLAAAALVALGASSAQTQAQAQAAPTSSAPGTVWLCRPGAAGDPCASSLTATVVTASGSFSVQHERDAASPPIDCFYLYPTVSTEAGLNADLTVQPAEIAVAKEQASRFSQVCRVWAPMYAQATVGALLRYPDLALPARVESTAYRSVASAFSDYLAHGNDGRPIVLIGHSQGAVMAIRLLQQRFEGDATLRRRLLMAIVLGGNVEVKDGSSEGGTFSDIPVCTRGGETGCVIAYSSFPGRPPAAALFGRPGQGVSLQEGSTASSGVRVACVDPASIAGRSGGLLSYFPSKGKRITTPWVEFPGLYSARCEHSGSAGWLEVTKATGPGDPRPVVSESAGPDWGYHADDVNLALGNLVADVGVAARSLRHH